MSPVALYYVLPGDCVVAVHFMMRGQNVDPVASHRRGVEKLTGNRVAPNQQVLP